MPKTYSERYVVQLRDEINRLRGIRDDLYGQLGKARGEDVVTWDGGYEITQATSNHNLRPIYAGDRVRIEGIVLKSEATYNPDCRNKRSSITIQVQETRLVKP